MSAAAFNETSGSEATLQNNPIGEDVWESKNILGALVETQYSGNQTKMLQIQITPIHDDIELKREIEYRRICYETEEI